MSEYKPINLTYYNPYTSCFKAGKSDRERVSLYQCCKSETCDAHKNDKCIMLNGLWGLNCPYGKVHKKEGYTKAARKCGKLVREYRDKYKDVEYALNTQNTLCKINDYVYTGLPHLRNYVNPIREKDFFTCEELIRMEDFTPEFIVELIKFRPHALFGGEIESYQKECIPKFCRQLKTNMPELYIQVVEIYPEIHNKIENINYVGKRAKVKTLLPGRVKLSTDILDWDGNVLKAKGKQVSFWSLKDEEVTIIPNENTVVGICENETVTDDTVIVE
ncbi:hypothetical protein F140042L4_20200 [Coprococcus phoceensis]